MPAVVLLGACRGLTGGGPPDPGGGTNSLTVNGTFRYDGRDTYAQISVWRADVPQDGAQVNLFPDYEKRAALENTGAGNYFAQLEGYAQGYELFAGWSSDWLEMRAVGPDIAEFTSPDPFTSVALDADETLTVTWTGSADWARVRIGPYDSGPLSPDPGTLVLGAEELTAGEYVIELERGTELVPAGGSGSALWLITTELETEAPVTITGP